MLYEAIRKGCELYHKEDERAYDEAYAEFFVDRCQSKWDNPETLDDVEIENLILFLDKFQAWGWPNRGKTKPTNFSTLPPVLTNLQPLSHKTILDVDFNDEKIRSLISSSFVELEKCGPDNKSWRVAASKILHLINPELFLMWDNSIRRGYDWPDYAGQFLPKMQQLAREAIRQIMDKESLSYVEASDKLESCIHTKKIPGLVHFPNKTAKVLDEYNFMKHTKMTMILWKVENDL